MPRRLALFLVAVAPMLGGGGASPQAAADRQAGLIVALVDLAEACYRAGRLGEALRLLDGGAALITRSEARPADLVRLELQRAKCVYYQASLAGAAYEPAVLALRAALQGAQASGDRVVVADARDLLGLALYSRAGRESAHEEARALFESALASRRSLGDRRGESESLFHLGLTFENRSAPSAEDLRRARECHEQALALAQAGEFQIEGSYAYRHLAGHLEEAGDLEGALRYFEESLRLREASGYALFVPPALLSVGDIWRAKKQPARAREFYLRALAEAERLGAQRLRAAARDALAELDAPPR